MKIETCNLCPETFCTNDRDGRLVTDIPTGRVSFTRVPIKSCDTREAIICLERNGELVELEDSHGLISPRLLGC